MLIQIATRNVSPLVCLVLVVIKGKKDGEQRMQRQGSLTSHTSTMSAVKEYSSKRDRQTAYHTYGPSRPEYRQDALEPAPLRRRYPDEYGGSQRMSYSAGQSTKQHFQPIDGQVPAYDYPSAYAPVDGRGPSKPRHQPSRSVSVPYSEQYDRHDQPHPHAALAYQQPSARAVSDPRPRLCLPQDTLPRMSPASRARAYPVEPSRVIPRRTEREHQHHPIPSAHSPIVAERPPEVPSKPQRDRSGLGKDPRQAEVELRHEPREAVRAEERSARERREIRRAPKEPSMKLDDMEETLFCPMWVATG